AQTAVVRTAITHDANHRNGFAKLFVENIPVAKRGAGSFIYRKPSLTPTLSKGATVYTQLSYPRSIGLHNESSNFAFVKQQGNKDNRIWKVQ
ncbi:MAG: hypothetical protein LBU44_04475, partial [Mediterranea sp.]|nr:hypothetical protein [Mediterranea sp.]